MNKTALILFRLGASSNRTQSVIERVDIKVFSIIGIISGAIGIVLTAVIAINLLSFITSSSFSFITAVFEELKK